MSDRRSDAPVPTIPCPVCNDTRVGKRDGRTWLCDRCYPPIVAAIANGDTGALAASIAALEAENAGLKDEVKRLSEAVISVVKAAGTVARIDFAVTNDGAPISLPAPSSVTAPHAHCQSKDAPPTVGKTCTHEGIGLPGCKVCDPRTKSQGGPQPDAAPIPMRASPAIPNVGKEDAPPTVRYSCLIHGLGCGGHTPSCVTTASISALRAELTASEAARAELEHQLEGWQEHAEEHSEMCAEVARLTKERDEAIVRVHKLDQESFVPATIDALVAAGMGRSGKSNCLVNMVEELTDERDSARAALTAERERWTKAIEECQQLVSGRQHPECRCPAHSALSPSSPSKGGGK